MLHFMSLTKKEGFFNFLSRMMVACLIYSLAWGQSSLAYAQARMDLPKPGVMVGMTSAYVPALLKGMTIHPDDPFRFDFIIDNGNSRSAGDALKKESQKLVNYFLTAMTVPSDDLWVNLSPVEKDRIIPDALNKTELGYGLLAQDYLLKQLTASLIYPESDLGKKFWDRVYQQASEKYGTSEIPTDTFNKVWIMPQEATVYERGNSVYIVDARLKVMLDADHAAMQSAGHSEFSEGSGQAISGVSDEAKIILREIVLPEIEKEVNSGENFAPLRQIYYSLIFAKWYKQKVRNSILSKVYIDRNKVHGIDLNDPANKQEMYERYMEAYQKGVYNYVKEDLDASTQQVIPRKYFSGGFQDAVITFNQTDKAEDVSKALIGDNFKLDVKIDAQEKQQVKKQGRTFRKGGIPWLLTLVLAAAIFWGCGENPVGPDWPTEVVPSDSLETNWAVVNTYTSFQNWHNAYSSSESVYLWGAQQDLRSIEYLYVRFPENQAGRKFVMRLRQVGQNPDGYAGTSQNIFVIPDNGVTVIPIAEFGLGTAALEHIEEISIHSGYIWNNEDLGPFVIPVELSTIDDQGRFVLVQHIEPWMSAGDKIADEKNVDHAMLDVVKGYAHKFALRAPRVWRTGKAALKVLFFMAFVAMVPIACTKAPTAPDTEIIDNPDDPAVVYRMVTDSLRTLITNDPTVVDTTSAYQWILWKGPAATDPLMDFVPNGSEQANPRRWGIRLLGQMGSEARVVDLFMDILGSTGSLYTAEHKTEAANALSSFLMHNTDQYGIFVQALSNASSQAEVDVLLSALYQAGGVFPSVLRALPEASAATQGTVKASIDAMITRIVNEALNFQYGYVTDDVNQALAGLGEGATEAIIAFCSDPNNDTDYRKMALHQLGYVGAYAASYDYLQHVINSGEPNYDWWHRVEAEVGFIYLASRQPAPLDVVAMMMQGSIAMHAAAYHVLYGLYIDGATASLDQFMAGLSNEPAVVREHIAWVMWHHFEHSEIIIEQYQALIQHLMQDPEQAVRDQLVATLFRVSGDQAVFNAMLAPMRDHPAAMTRISMIQGFGNMGSAASGALATLAYIRDHDTDADVVAWAVWAIQAIQGGRMSPPRGMSPAVDHAQATVSTDVTKGYSRKFVLRSPRLWYAVKKTMIVLLITAVLGVAPIGCTKNPVGPTQEQIDERLPEYLRQLTMDNEEDMYQSDAYMKVINMVGTGALSPALISFAQNENEDINARRWAIFFLRYEMNEESFNFLINVTADTTGLFLPIHKEETYRVMTPYLQTHLDKYLLFVDYLASNPASGAADGVLSAIYDIGKNVPGVLNALPLGLERTAGVIHEKIDNTITQVVDQTLSQEYTQLYNGRLLVLQALGEIVTDRVIAFCRSGGNNTDARKMAMFYLGYVGEYVKTFNYLKEVVESNYGYEWWHRMEAERGLVVLIMRQSDPQGIVNNILNTSGASDHIQGVAYHVLYKINTTASIQQFLDGLRNSPDSYVRYHIIALVVSLPYNDLDFIIAHRDFLFNCLANESDQIVWSTLIDAFFNVIDSDGVFQELLQQLRVHLQPGVRIYIAQRFGGMGSAAVAALPTLEYVRDHDPDAGVRAAAAQAIADITGGGAGKRSIKPSSMPLSQQEVDHAQASDLGGIDMKDIQINGFGQGVIFSPMVMHVLQQGRVDGFSPVIIQITPVKDVLPLLI